MATESGTEPAHDAAVAVAAPVDAMPEFPVVDCAALLTVDEIVQHCKIARADLTMKPEGEGMVTPAADVNPTTKSLCQRLVTKRRSETEMRFSVIGYRTPEHPLPIRKAWEPIKKYGQLATEQTDVYHRRDISEIRGRYQYSMMIVIQKDRRGRIEPFCSDDAMRALWKLLEDRLASVP